MASGSSMPLFRKKNEDLYVNQEQDTHVPHKKQRNCSDHVTEVIALSPTTLLAKNKFFCEVCNKGFPREQNLQLHMRGHNMPWNLKQNSTKEKDDTTTRKLYVCPEASCVHHHPSHALGDFSGIKKHYFRKHCEKHYKCQKCLKMYAIQSDLNAHLKTCVNREFRSHFNTLSSRRDSGISHRAFCDAKADGGGRIMYPSAMSNHHPGQTSASLPQPIGTSSSTKHHKYQENSSDTRTFTNLVNKNTSTQHDKSKEPGNGEGSSLFSGNYDTTTSMPQSVETALFKKADLRGSLPSSSSAICATSERINRKSPSADKPNSNVTELVNPFSSSGPNVVATYEQQHDGSSGGHHDDEHGFALLGTWICNNPVV